MCKVSQRGAICRLMVVERLSFKRQELITMPFTNVAIKVDSTPMGMIIQSIEERDEQRRMFHRGGTPWATEELTFMCVHPVAFGEGCNDWIRQISGGCFAIQHGLTVADKVAEALEKIGTPEALHAVAEWRKNNN